VKLGGEVWSARWEEKVFMKPAVVRERFIKILKTDKNYRDGRMFLIFLIHHIELSLLK